VKTGFITLAAILLFATPTFALPLLPLAPHEMASRAEAFKHLAWNGKSLNKGITEQSGCAMRNETIQVDDPVSKTSMSYDLLLQYPKADHPLPVVIIVPTIQGTQEYLEPRIAYSLCQAGFASIIADVNDFRQPKQYPAWGAEDITNRKAILALETVVDFAQGIPQFDKNKIGAIGLSLGGITTSMWTSLDPRLKATVIVVGGGNLPFILSHSDEPNVVELRDRRMAAGDLKSIDDYDSVLRSNIKLDPFYFAPLANRHRILMVMAESDMKVPYAAQLEQFNAFGQPQSITFMGGHVLTILEVIYFYMGDVETFLAEKFNLPSPAPMLSPMMLAPMPHKVVDLDKLGY
jgi:hypothetical protein